jgi:ribosomal-protein-alanine N-acetyltransferase
MLVGPLHAAALAAIHAAAFPAAERWSAKTFSDLLELPGVVGVVASDWGFVLARIAADEAEVLTLAVTPAHRRRGIARRLMQHVIAHLRTLGATVLFLEVAVANVPALGLYAAFGFCEVAKRPGYYASGEAAALLRLSLTPSVARPA